YIVYRINVGFIINDPGNFKDVIDNLLLENVISNDTHTNVNQTVDVRKQFVHFYDELDTIQLKPLFDKTLDYYQQFIDEVRQFLNNENVPITAFGQKGEK